MEWLNDLMITFSAVAASHLGLVAAIERTVKHRLPIIGCPKCASFWAVLAYGALTSASPGDAPGVVAAAFLAAWAAIWLELAMGYTDQLYLRAYDKIYPAAGAAGADAPGATDAVPGMPRGEGGDAGKGGDGKEAGVRAEAEA